MTIRGFFKIFSLDRKIISYLDEIEWNWKLIDGTFVSTVGTTLKLPKESKYLLLGILFVNTFE